ncbi:hypothetical protein AN963_27660 [Brevibacillus choshinensis]|uniref:DUF3888 domain-containing protein n=1 Tax=Brevibacillus choshinensis TaxID=54911 RepID=A0ABR5N3L8_BRECH|nr:hypothetical protein [Brevibacillus choshinensis]KQL45085.1 hypothetical protein AN963_27660 [Brevibacillus choshinensis]
MFKAILTLGMVLSLMTGSSFTQSGKVDTEQSPTIPPVKSEIRKVMLDDAYNYYSALVNMDRRNEKITYEFQESFLDFTIRNKAKNGSERYFMILVSSLYFSKFDLDFPSVVDDPEISREEFDQAAAKLKKIFEHGQQQ